jgi:hypothetical protein
MTPRHTPHHPNPRRNIVKTDDDPSRVHAREPRDDTPTTSEQDSDPMKSDATSVDQYVEELPPDRREAIAAVRDVIRANLPRGFDEVMQYGMISYVVPLERYPNTYNGEALAVASLANQKRHMALYLMGVYGDEGDQEWLRQRWAETGKKLDMGKSCLRFRRLDDLALDIVGAAIARTSVDDFIAAYERSRPR